VGTAVSQIVSTVPFALKDKIALGMSSSQSSYDVVFLAGRTRWLILSQISSRKSIYSNQSLMSVLFHWRKSAG